MKFIKIIKKILYNSYKDPILSSSIPLEYYKIYDNIRHGLINSSVKNIQNIPYYMNEILTKDDYLLTSFSINRNQLFVELLKDNLKCSIDMLILDIKNSIRDIINNLERTKTNLESDLSSKQYELNKLENINNMSVEGFGNKGKKKI